jgi:anhydro-N-acetylmuramic acid kinase
MTPQLNSKKSALKSKLKSNKIYLGEIYFGLMSGTSCDGFDLLGAEFDENGQYIQTIASEAFPYSENLMANLHAVTTDLYVKKSTLNEINRTLAHAWADGLNQCFEKNKISRKQIKGLGIHGHTIDHSPSSEFAGSWQLCEPNIIAVKTGVPVITDFRNMDIALGGQGAPLLPPVHRMLFQDQTGEISRVICNIGGISNITVLKSDTPLSGYDTGPGNTLIDAWARHVFQISYDKNGDIARRGKIHIPLLHELLRDSYFSKPSPKSTGREHFHLNWLEAALKKISAQISPEDILATLTELTAKTIATETLQHIQQGEIILCGGGSHNLFLVERLQANLSNQICKAIPVKSSQDFGVDPNMVEALGFAWLARQRIHRLPGNSPHTGAKSLGILGGLWQA